MNEVKQLFMESMSKADAAAYYSQLFDALPSLVWAADSKGACDFVSRQFVAYTGRSVEQLIHEGWQDAMHLEDKTFVCEKWHTAIADGSEFNAELRLRRHDGNYRWFKAQARAIRDAGGRVIRWFGACTDIEDQKSAEEELRKSDRRKDEFLGILAHEIRNPLAALSAGVNLLNHPRTNPERAAFVKETMRQRVLQLARLIDDLLDVSRIAQGKISLVNERTPVSLFAERAIEVVRDAVEDKGHRFSVSIDEQLHVNGDPARLEQIVVNLLLNAIKFTEAGGLIDLSIYREDDSAVISVKDNGIGIAPEVLPHIFELFGQADKSLHRTNAGLGIGLTLVRKLAEMHEGTVSAKSEGSGRGSEFLVRLPLAMESSDEVYLAQEAELSDESFRILVVEDHRDTAIMSAALLQMHGHLVEVAYDGPSGLEAALQTKPDIIVLDLGLPGMSGYEVARGIRRNASFTPLIVAMTGYGQAKDFERSKEAGIDYHFLKPIDYEAMVPVLADWKRRSHQAVHA